MENSSIFLGTGTVFNRTHSQRALANPAVRWAGDKLPGERQTITITLSLDQSREAQESIYVP